ncbi:MAG: outer membrane protein assembly factor BamA [Gemmatimonadetes bacterium]|nr:outer membrane protein assembly factor BamA [Gemmatimonadota bacterium]
MRGVVQTGLAILVTLLLAALAWPGAAILFAQEQAAAAGPVVIDSVKVQGNQRRPEAVVQAESGLRAGDTITFREIQRAIRRLWVSGHYRDVQVYARQAGGGPSAPVVLVVQVAEQPYIGDVEFRGLEHVNGRTVRDTVGLNPGVPLRPSKVAEAEHMMRKLLADKGYRVRAIEHRLEPIRDRPGEQRLVFQVTEGHRIALAAVEFEGNQVFDDEQLRKALDTKPEGFFWFRDGTYEEAKLQADLRDKLPEFYAQRGYIDFAVGGDTLVVDPERGKARLVVKVNEGERYQLAAFDVRGNRRFPADELKRYFDRERGGLLRGLGFGSDGGKEGGGVFDQVAFQRATDRVSQLYRNQGYLYARVQPVIERTETAGGEPAVQVAWEIREGEPAYVNRVSVTGNTFTHENVIRDRILLLPGDVYNEDLLIQSYKNVMALGFFETPLPLPDIQPNDKGDVDITFDVKERQTGAINFGTALGGGTGVAGFLGYDQPNLFGQAKAGHLRWEFGRFSNNLEASYSDPAMLGSRVSGSASLFSARDRFFRFSEGQRRRTGGSLRFGLPLPTDRWSRVFLGYSLSRTTYQQASGLETASLFALPPGVQSTISLSLVRNTLDHPLFPVSGTRHELEGSFSGGLLGGDGDFQKYTAGASWYVPAGQVGGGQPGSRPIRFTLGVSAEAGALFGNAERFPFERFWMGGVQFGRPLRGYEETTVTPRGHIPRGVPGVLLEDRFGDAYLRLSAEYAVRFNDNLSLSLFYDAGNVWRSPREINPTRLLRGAGLGVTLVTPFGPLGLDYAYGFDKVVPGWQLHFKLGPTF